RTDAGERVAAPVVQQARGFRGDAPVCGVGAAPLVHFLAHAVDDGGMAVLLAFAGKPFAFVENECALIACITFALAWLGDGRDEIGGTARLKNVLRRLTGAVQFPVARRMRIWGVEDRALEESVGH